MAQKNKEDSKKWSQIVRHWRASGLTRKEYCELHNVEFSKLKYWVQRVDKQKKMLVGENGMFVEASIIEDKKNHCEVETGRGSYCSITFGKGHEIIVSTKECVSYLQELIQLFK